MSAARYRHLLKRWPAAAILAPAVAFCALSGALVVLMAWPYAGLVALAGAAFVADLEF